MAERVGPEVRVEFVEDPRRPNAGPADKHKVPRECTLSVVLGYEAESDTSYIGRPCLRWRNRLDAKTCHVLDVLAEDHRQNRPPYVIVFHSQPLKLKGGRRPRPQRRR